MRTAPQQFLRARHRFRASFRQRRTPSQSRVDQGFLRHDGVHQSDSQGFRRVDEFAGEEQPAGGAFADVPQQVRHHHCRDQPTTHLRIAELRLRYGDCEIAHRREPGTARHRSTVHRGDGRLRQSVNLFVECREFRSIIPDHIGSIAECAAKFVEVHPGTKCGAVSRENDRANGVVLFGPDERLGERRNQFARKGIPLVRAVDGEDRGRPAAFVEHVSGHGT